MSEVNIRTGRRRLEALQLLRGVAAALVVYVHSFDTFRDKVHTSVSLTTAVGLGELGVKIFFCISGFIIFESIQNISSGTPSLLSFAKKRLIRILPLYWLATLIYASKQALTGSPPPLKDLIFSLLFIPYPDDNGLMRPVIGAGWTLNFEMLFYGAAAVTILFSKNIRAPLLVIAMGALAVAEGVVPQGINTFLDIVSLITSDYLLFFLAGIFCSAVSKHTAAHRTYHSVLSLMIPAVLVGIFIVTTNKFGLPDAFQFPATLALCVGCVWTSTLYRGDVQADDTKSLHSRVKKMSVAAGDGSYSTYLTHGFVMGPCARIVKTAGIDLSPTLFAIIMVVICSTIGALIFSHMEKPLQKILSRRFIGNPTLKPAT